MSKELPINSENQQKLDIIRHDCAHVLAEAVQSLFPNTQVTIGPTIENGFYYDFAREKPFTSDDLNFDVYYSIMIVFASVAQGKSSSFVMFPYSENPLVKNLELLVL